MRATALAVLVLLLLPSGVATHAANVQDQIFAGSPVTGRFEFGQTGVRPPAVVEGFLVFENREQPVIVNGSVLLLDATTAEDSGDRLGQQFSRERELRQIEEHLQPYETVRIPVSVPVQGIGTVQVVFRPNHDFGEPVRMNPAELVGVAPLSVSLVGTDLQEPLVSLPGRPAALSVILTALPGSNLTDLRLTASEVQEIVDVGDLAPGESATATLTVVADGDQRFRGVDRSAITPVLQGMEDGVPFAHPLYRNVGGDFEPIHPAVYIAAESAIFIVPPTNVRLGVPTTIDVILLNAGTRTLRAHGQIELILPGMPHLKVGFNVAQSLPPERVETIQLDWTPPAAGPWQATVRHDLGKRQQFEQIPVSGPIESMEVQVTNLSVKRGTPTTLSVTLTASENISVDGLRLATTHLPLEGWLSVDDLFSQESVPEQALEAGAPATRGFVVTPKATGSYDLYIVVDTSEGPSIHHWDLLVVHDAQNGWWAAASPTMLLMMLIVVQVVWRRRWVA